MRGEEETITIHDSKDFHYEVTVKHFPHFGFSTAYLRDRIIGQVELHKIHKPYSDHDREWEEWEERFAEWRDEILKNLRPICKQYIDREYAKAISL